MKRIQAGSDDEYLCKDKWNNWYIENFDNYTLHVVNGAHEFDLEEIVCGVVSNGYKKMLIHYLNEGFLRTRVRPFQVENWNQKAQNGDKTRIPTMCRYIEIDSFQMQSAWEIAVLYLRSHQSILAFDALGCFGVPLMKQYLPESKSQV